MKRRIGLFAVVIVLVLSVVVASSAASFELRNGIKWYMSKEDVMAALRTERDFDKYEIDDETSDWLRTNLVQVFPQEKTNPKLWILYIENISLGGNNEQVICYLCGTQTHGLYDSWYTIYVNSNNDDSYYNRAKDLTAQLSKKYGSFKEEDNWKKKKNKKTGDKVYESWKTLDDGTYILLWITKDDNGYSLSIEYQSPRLKEIEESITDGSIYIEPAFGL